ncbi:MAG: beta-lactamase family protein, partial [Gemmatimonadetes bacterium]|nr:beta-lactamase family protein [Gemmatimonadota bacterium]
MTRRSTSETVPAIPKRSGRTSSALRRVARLSMLAVAAGSLTPAAANAQAGLSPEARITIDAIALDPIEAGHVAGMSIGAIRGADTLVLAAYGSADLELGVPTPDDAVYEIGSVTKQFTAVALLLLQERGRLSLDDPLTRWIPDYPLGDRELSLRRLLDHTSGIKGYTEMPAVWTQIVPLDLPPDTLVTLFGAEPFEFEPGEAMIYNNSAYFLLGLVIEKASGQTYEEFVEEHLFAAAGMVDSRYCHKDELTPRRAKGYQPGADGLVPAPYLNHRWPYAAGSLCSTIRDMVRWNQALHGDGDGGPLLTSASYQSLITPEPLNDGTQVRYAKGLAITSRDGERRISHGGGIFGFVSELRYLPEEDLTIVVLMNTAGSVGSGTIAGRVEEVLLGSIPEPIERSLGGELDAYTG